MRKGPKDCALVLRPHICLHPLVPLSLLGDMCALSQSLPFSGYLPHPFSFVLLSPLSACFVYITGLDPRPDVHTLALLFPLGSSLSFPPLHISSPFSSISLCFWPPIFSFSIISLHLSPHGWAQAWWLCFATKAHHLYQRDRPRMGEQRTK